MPGFPSWWWALAVAICLGGVRSYDVRDQPGFITEINLDSSGQIIQVEAICIPEVTTINLTPSGDTTRSKTGTNLNTTTPAEIGTVAQADGYHLCVATFDELEPFGTYTAGDTSVQMVVTGTDNPPAAILFDIGGYADDLSIHYLTNDTSACSTFNGTTGTQAGGTIGTMNSNLNFCDGVPTQAPTNSPTTAAPTNLKLHNRMKN